MMQVLQAPFRAGDLVRVRGHLWTVQRITTGATNSLLDLAGAGSTNRRGGCVLVLPFDRPRAIVRSPCRLVSRASGMRRLRDLLATNPPWDRLRAPASANVDLYPFQLEPAVAVARGLATRLLLADEVGLGKTIQAALVLAELLARGDQLRGMILAPASLCDQWRQELLARTAIDATIVDTHHLRVRAAELPPHVNPWAVPRVVISSIDLVKRPETFVHVEAVPWDVLIVDEAHAAAAMNDRRAAAEALARRARHVLLLTATPHSGDPAAFASLCRIGGFDHDGPILMFRRSRRDVGLPACRHNRCIGVSLTAAEIRAHAVLRTYVDLVRRESGHGEALLAMIVLMKRAFSSAGSLARTARRRLAALQGDAPDATVQMTLPLFAEDSDDRDAEPLAGLSAPGLKDQHREGALLEDLIRAAEDASRDESKLAFLVRFLRRAPEAAIVFTEYRDTLERVASALGPIATVGRLHGGLDRSERFSTIARFRSGQTRILVATDAAGEGLNLQSNCRLVINLELPWSPTRLEQRIGRVDRIGQSRTVHAVQLVAAGTGESDILARLAARVGRARQALGSMPDVLHQRDVADLMLTGAQVATVGEARDVARAEPPPDADVHGGVVVAGNVLDVAKQDAAHAQWIRSMLERNRPCRRSAFVAVRRPADVDDGQPVAFQLRRSAFIGPGLCCLYRVAIADSSGRVIETHLVPLFVRVPLSRHRRRHEAADELRALFEPRRPQLLDCARRAAEARRRLIGDAVKRATHLARARESAIVSLTDRDLKVATGLIQDGLFDRRALREAREARARRERRRAAAAVRLASLDAGLEVVCHEPELVLVIVCPPHHA